MKINKKFFTTPFICALVILSVATLAISQIDKKTKDELYSQIELFSYALTTIQSEYVDEQKPKDLIYGSLKGMLASLDPHSQFLDPDDYKELKTETQGKFGGLGIEISIRDGLLTVIAPIEDTPAWKAGIKAGDKIVKIEDELTKDITLSDAVKKLRGKPGTEVSITVLREGELKLLDFKITREIIHVNDIKDPMVLQENIGYIRLAEFREDSYKEFHGALTKLKEQGIDSLILDLRNNPGGLLNVAIKITEEFLPEGAMVVSTKGRRESQNTETRSTNTSPDFVNIPMVVLINEGSASGSEILAGALKDNKRAITLGTKSFGKGSVQSVIPLPDGSGLRLTTSKYYTPSGKSIHGIGIIPDVEVEFEVSKMSDEEREKEELEKVFGGVEGQVKKTDSSEEKEKPKPAPVEEKPEATTSEDGVKTKDEKKGEKPLTKEEEARKKLLRDSQVQAAINVIKGIRIYRNFGTPAPTKPTTPTKS